MLRFLSGVLQKRGKRKAQQSGLIAAVKRSSGQRPAVPTRTPEQEIDALQAGSEHLVRAAQKNDGESRERLVASRVLENTARERKNRLKNKKDLDKTA